MHVRGLLAVDQLVEDAVGLVSLVGVEVVLHLGCLACPVGVVVEGVGGLECAEGELQLVSSLAALFRGGGGGEGLECSLFGAEGLGAGKGGGGGGGARGQLTWALPQSMFGCCVQPLEDAGELLEGVGEGGGV